jgi:hypothetical protein
METATPQFSKDKPVVFLIFVNTLITLATLITVFLRLRSHDLKVPVQHIVNDGSVLQTGSWYSLYSFALLALLGTGVVFFLSHRLHKGNRLFALGTLIAYTVVNIFGLLSTIALLGLVSKV